MTGERIGHLPTIVILPLILLIQFFRRAGTRVQILATGVVCHFP